MIEPWLQPNQEEILIHITMSLCDGMLQWAQRVFGLIRSACETKTVNDPHRVTKIFCHPIVSLTRLLLQGIVWGLQTKPLLHFGGLGIMELKEQPMGKMREKCGGEERLDDVC